MPNVQEKKVSARYIRTVSFFFFWFLFSLFDLVVIIYIIITSEQEKEKMDRFSVAKIFRCQGCGLPFSMTSPSDRVYVERYAEWLLDHHGLANQADFVNTDHPAFPDGKLPREWQVERVLNLLDGWFHCPITCLPALDSTEDNKKVAVSNTGVLRSTLCHTASGISVSVAPPPHAIGPFGFPDFLEDRLQKINALAGHPLQLPVHLPEDGCFRQERSELVRHTIELLTVLNRIEWEQSGDSPEPIRPWSDVPWTCDQYPASEETAFPAVSPVPLSHDEAPNVFRLVRRMRAILGQLCSSKLGYPSLSSSENDQTLTTFLETEAFNVLDPIATLKDKIKCLDLERENRKREREDAEYEMEKCKKKIRELRAEKEPPESVTVCPNDMLQLLMPVHSRPWLWSGKKYSAAAAAARCARCRRTFKEMDDLEAFKEMRRLAKDSAKVTLYRLSPDLFTGNEPDIAKSAYCSSCVKSVIRRKIGFDGNAQEDDDIDEPVTLDRTKVLRRARRAFGNQHPEYHRILSILDKSNQNK